MENNHEFEICIPNGIICHCFSCKTNYLPAVGNEYKCFHQDILIGVCVGVGGALIIGLIMLTVYFACKSSKAEYVDDVITSFTSCVFLRQTVS